MKHFPVTRRVFSSCQQIWKYPRMIWWEVKTLKKKKEKKSRAWCFCMLAIADASCYRSLTVNKDGRQHSSSKVKPKHPDHQTTNSSAHRLVSVTVGSFLITLLFCSNLSSNHGRMAVLVFGISGLHFCTVSEVETLRASLYTVSISDSMLTWVRTSWEVMLFTK